MYVVCFRWYTLALIYRIHDIVGWTHTYIIGVRMPCMYVYVYVQQEVVISSATGEPPGGVRCCPSREVNIKSDSWLPDPPRWLRHVSCVSLTAPRTMVLLIETRDPTTTTTIIIININIVENNTATRKQEDWYGLTGVPCVYFNIIYIYT